MCWWPLMRWVCGLALLLDLYSMMVILLNVSYSYSCNVNAMSFAWLYFSCMVMELKWWLGIIVVVVYIGLEIINRVCCMNVLFDKSMALCYGTLFPMLDVVACILLAIYKFSCVACWECFALLRTLGGIKYCVRFSVPRNLVKTLSHVWSSGKGFCSPVWSSGRGLVRVLYPLACVK